MTELLVRPVLQAPVPRRFTRTLTGFTVDVWAIQRWNSTNQTTMDAYAQGPETIDHRTHCTRDGCTTHTAHHTGVCYQCRKKDTYHPTRHQYQPCEGPGCTVRTRHETQLCHYCRIYMARYMLAINHWYVCNRDGCGRATTNPAGICCRCVSGHRPDGPGHHWSLRWRNFLNTT